MMLALRRSEVGADFLRARAEACAGLRRGVVNRAPESAGRRLGWAGVTYRSEGDVRRWSGPSASGRAHPDASKGALTSAGGAEDGLASVPLQDMGVASAVGSAAWTVPIGQVTAAVRALPSDAAVAPDHGLRSLGVG